MKSFAQCIETLVRTSAAMQSPLSTSAPRRRPDRGPPDRPPQEMARWLRNTAGRSTPPRRSVSPDSGRSTMRRHHLPPRPRLGRRRDSPASHRQADQVRRRPDGARPSSPNATPTLPSPSAARAIRSTRSSPEARRPAADAKPLPWRSGSLAAGAKATASEKAKSTAATRPAPTRRSTTTTQRVGWAPRQGVLAAGRSRPPDERRPGRPAGVLHHIQPSRSSTRTATPGRRAPRRNHRPQVDPGLQAVTAQTFRLNITKWSLAPRSANSTLPPP